MVATDLDGTLLDSTGDVSPRTRRALRLAREAGAEIVFVTARPPRGIDPIAAAADVTGTVISSNGALVYDLDSKRAISMYPLDPAVLRTLVDTLSAALPGIAFAVETGQRVLVEAGYTRRNVHNEAYCLEIATVREVAEPAVKLLAYTPAYQVDDMLAAALAAAAGQAEITHSGGAGILEISALGVTKAGTLDLLCRERGVSADEVVAFGDMPNDLAVLAYAGAGYAMANAHPLVLEATELRTLSNDEDGVAVVLERLFTTGQAAPESVTGVERAAPEPVIGADRSAPDRVTGADWAAPERVFGADRAASDV
ncbi:HAD-IIB family hydrolase [Nonomuraea sp. NN258]|nr:HAD-IIB family hydrolase [Nonomuraea antri]